MTNNGAVNKTITPSTSAQTYTIPAGYHNGSGKVTVNAASIAAKSLNGTVSMTPVRWGTCTGTVNFSSTFSKAPTVIATAKDASGDSKNVTISSVTAGGFNYSIYHGEDNTEKITMTWNATA